MDGIINIKEMKELKQRVKLLVNVDGIINQIDHLCRPDDNEIFNYVFDYLSNSIDSMMEMLKILKNDILKFRGREPGADHIDIDKVKKLFETRYGKTNVINLRKS